MRYGDKQSARRDIVWGQREGGVGVGGGGRGGQLIGMCGDGHSAVDKYSMGAREGGGGGQLGWGGQGTNGKHPVEAAIVVAYSS